MPSLAVRWGIVGLLVLTVCGVATPAQALLLVASRQNDRILKFDENTGDYLGIFSQDASLGGPQDIVKGADGKIYVSNFGDNSVTRYTPVGTGAAMTGTSPEIGHTVNGATGMKYGTNGKLYVASNSGNNVLRFATSNFSAGPEGFSSNGALTAPAGLAFASNGKFYVTSNQTLTDRILRFNADGSFDTLLDSGNAAGLDGPQIGLLIGPDGFLYASMGTNSGAKKIVRYNTTTLAFDSVYLDLTTKLSSPALGVPHGLAFLPNGDLIFAVDSTTALADRLYRYNGTTQTLTPFDYAPEGLVANILDGPRGILLLEDLDETAVPEPSSLVLAGVTALLGAAAYRRRMFRAS